MKFNYCIHVKTIAAIMLLGLLAAPTVAGDTSLPIKVINPKTLSVKEIPCERISIGEPGDYKACVAKLPSGELLLTMFHMYKNVKGKKYLEPNLLFRSNDGGRTWSGPEKLDLLGREPYLTVISDSTIFITGHFLPGDVRNKHGYVHCYMHRSTDGGKTWESLCIDSDALGQPGIHNNSITSTRNHITSTRNVLELADGTLLLGIDCSQRGHFMWRSTDRGKTWDRSRKCKPVGFKSGFFGGETWLWQTRSGKIIAFVRVDSNDFPIEEKLEGGTGSDHDNHEMLWESTDEGRTFGRVCHFGDYGQMYPSLLRLRDGRLLYTYTQRALQPPPGVRALVGTEQEDGFTFEFDSDLLLIDYKTPVGKPQGGCFGPTVQLDDGTLVTSYTYRGADNQTYAEVARWRLE